MVQGPYARGNMGEERIRVRPWFKAHTRGGNAGERGILCGYLPGNGHPQYDVSSDDQRFVMLRIDDDDSVTDELIVVENFFEELKAKVGN